MMKVTSLVSMVILYLVAVQRPFHGLISIPFPLSYSNTLHYVVTSV